MLPFEVPTLADVPEGAKDFYKAVNGKLQLITDTNVAEFRTNNINLTNQLETIKTKIAAFGTATPESIAATQAELKAIKADGAKDKGDKATVENQLAEALTRIGALETRNVSLDSNLSVERATNAITLAATAAGADPRMVDDVVARARADGWQVDDTGNAVRKIDGAVKLSDEAARAGQNQLPSEYFVELFVQKPGFKSASGGGGGKANAGESANAPRIIPNDPVQMGLAADDIASGKAVVQGTTDAAE